MKKNLLASLAVASTLGFFTPLTSQAFGLGKLELMSALNEPFKAEIDVTALRADEKDNLQIRIASDEEFQKAGLDRSILLGQLQFDIVQRQGKTRILVTSKQAVKEPFLDFLLTATAGSGRLIREYTVLLDPPAYVMAESANVSTKAIPVAKATVETAESSTTRYQYAANTGSYDVKRSDTLWNIALKTRPSNAVSVHQMMMALLKDNPRAFTNGNVNGLRAGVTLQIPSQDQINALSKSAAAAAFAEQTQAWKNRNKVTAPVTTAATQTAESTTTDVDDNTAVDNETSAEMAAEQDMTDAVVASENDGRLQLVAPEEEVTNEDDASPNVAGDDQLQKLTEQLTLAQETIEAQQQENIDFEARMAAMEEQLETMRRLISLKDADLARLQSKLEQEDPAAAAEVQTAEADGTAEVETMPQQESMKDDSNSVADTAGATDDTSMPAADTKDKTTKLISEAANALNLDEQEVLSVVDQVKQFVREHKLETALGLLLILLVLWLIARRSNREVTWDEAVKKMDTKQAGADGPVVVTPVSNNDETVTDAPLTDETDEKTVGELVEQADMFVGYADYVQAKNALELARRKEPENTLVAYKTLFVLFKQQQTDDFVALAEETEFDHDSFEWQEIKQWGQELAPAHDLFIDSPSIEQTDSVDETDPVQPAEIDDASAALSEDVDSEQPATARQQNEHIDFDLNDFAANTSEQDDDEIDSETESVATDSNDDLLSFDSGYKPDDNDEALDLDVANDDAEDDNLSFDMDVPDETADLTDVDLDSDDNSPDLEFDVGDLDDLDEAETKLDLAAAYIDMDDPDGAKSILNEVLVEGNEEQKNRAHSLLESLS